MPRIEFDAVSKSFGRSVAVRDLSLSIADGEYLTLLGPSGGGKSTVLRLLAGLEAPDRGGIRIDGRDVQRMAPADRGVALMFQNHALFPQLTVRENLALGRKLRGSTLPEQNAGVTEVVGVLGIEPLLDRLPEQLSGGERQRVALGRALASQARILLLDEPLSDLEPPLRGRLRSELSHLARTRGLTVLHVTHDQREALALGDRLAVMRAGELQQVGSPEAVYGHPSNPFVARFVGEPPMNLARQQDGSWLGVRPEHLTVVSSPDSAAVFTGELIRVEYTGRERWLWLRHAGDEWVIAWPVAQLVPPVGSRLTLRARPEDQHRFPGTAGALE